jgi:adenylylsulfate reductase subunit B
MSIKIEKEKCIGCGKCTLVCPGSLLKIDDENKSNIKYPKDCWGCTACVKECPVAAIKFYLEKDVGGKGAYLYVSEEENSLLNWHIFDKEGKEQLITIDRKDSNKY